MLLPSTVNLDTVTSPNLAVSKVFNVVSPPVAEIKSTALTVESIEPAAVKSTRPAELI